MLLKDVESMLLPLRRVALRSMLMVELDEVDPDRPGDTVPWRRGQLQAGLPRRGLRPCRRAAGRHRGLSQGHDLRREAVQLDLGDADVAPSGVRVPRGRQR